MCPVLGVEDSSIGSQLIAYEESRFEVLDFQAAAVVVAVV
jgi:hypothetical protein